MKISFTKLKVPCLLLFKDTYIHSINDSNSKPHPFELARDFWSTNPIQRIISDISPLLQLFGTNQCYPHAIVRCAEGWSFGVKKVARIEVVLPMTSSSHPHAQCMWLLINTAKNDVLPAQTPIEGRIANNRVCCAACITTPTCSLPVIYSGIISPPIIPHDTWSRRVEQSAGCVPTSVVV